MEKRCEIALKIQCLVVSVHGGPGSSINMSLLYRLPCLLNDTLMGWRDVFTFPADGLTRKHCELNSGGGGGHLKCTPRSCLPPNLTLILTLPLNPSFQSATN